MAADSPSLPDPSSRAKILWKSPYCFPSICRMGLPRPPSNKFHFFTIRFLPACHLPQRVARMPFPSQSSWQAPAGSAQAQKSREGERKGGSHRETFPKDALNSSPLFPNCRLLLAGIPRRASAFKPAERVSPHSCPRLTLGRRKLAGCSKEAAASPRTQTLSGPSPAPLRPDQSPQEGRAEDRSLSPLSPLKKMRKTGREDEGRKRLPADVPGLRAWPINDSFGAAAAAEAPRRRRHKQGLQEHRQEAGPPNYRLTLL